MIEDMIIGITAVILCILWFIIAWYYFKLRDRARLLDNRESNLEQYGSDLDNWDTHLKTRETSVTAGMRYMCRLAKIDPQFKEYMSTLMDEMMKDEEG